MSNSGKPGTAPGTDAPFRRRHWILPRLLWIALAGAPVLVSLTIPPEALPVPACLFREFTGRPCPSCGFTRSFYLMSDGAWRQAFRFCPLGAGLYIACLAVAAANLLLLPAGRTAADILRRIRIPAVPCLAAVLFLVLVNWLYRLALPVLP
mgnify:CR=1 FL=1